ncbi:hypothetical protein Poli38472_010582 [Pythium oligandrum]|uniref:PX domain-containing protein n=1 Tax=Pythium oligandrum TaxID=41045 RepID=A0A8K1C3E9_PYTOL|nr:hypothetical protein Poli38472_010582 [Pythium oligandrum]|eukprot:TMW55700.1 hypothetical protein Poli38472_010582 [Pythium oligandrum]
MPYESFATEQVVKITEVVQDPTTNAWMYMVRVQRGGIRVCDEEEEDGFSHEYMISRRFSEFKQLHTELAPIMGDKLTPLPADGLMTLIMADNEELLNTRKEVLEQILLDILNHQDAKELPEVLEFLGFESLGAKIMPPLFNSGQCVGSIRNTSSPCWTTMNPSRSSIVSS